MSAEQEAQQAFEEGARLLNSGGFDAALIAFNRAIASKPVWAEAWQHRAWAQGGLGMAKQALKSCEKALKLKRDYAEAWVFRGLVLEMGLGRYQEAVESYERALELKPDYDLASGSRIETLRTLEKWVRSRLPPKPHVDAYETVTFIEERLHIFIRQRLQQALGKGETEWWHKGVPEPIRKKCAVRLEEDPKRRPAYSQTDLLDLKDIMDKNWRHFEADFKKMQGQFKSKKEFLDNLVRLNEIRRTVMHPVRGDLTDADLAFANQMREVVEGVTPSG